MQYLILNKKREGGGAAGQGVLGTAHWTINPRSIWDLVKDVDGSPPPETRSLGFSMQPKITLFSLRFLYNEMKNRSCEQDMHSTRNNVSNFDPRYSSEPVK